MSIGLLLLVAVGKENLYFNYKPEITYFKTVYKRHTNFSIEPIPQYFKSSPDFSRRCTVNISKNADLLSNIYLYVKLPDISLNNHSFLPKNIKKFSWVNKIGIAIINYIELEIGGHIIDRHYMDWINIWHELILNAGIKKGYDKMIGNLPHIYTFSNGKSSININLPLTFWFCNDHSVALPLLSLINSDIKIHVEFNDFDKCYKTTPTHYITINENFCLFEKDEFLIQNVNSEIIIGQFVYFDVINQRIYYNQIKGTFNNDPNYNIIGKKTNFNVSIKQNSFIIKDESYFRFNTPSIIESYLIVNYIYLDNFERTFFINNEHKYIIPIVQSLSEQTIYNTNFNYKLSLVNPNKFIIWYSKLLYNNLNNDIFNYTTKPFTNNEENIIINNKLIINSQDFMNLYDSEYYTFLPKYQYKLSDSQNGIYIYSFCIDPKSINPNGTMNFSKTQDASLQLIMNKIINYQNPALIRLFSYQYVIFSTSNGIGGIIYDI
jgi:hypothetical protein